MGAVLGTGSAPVFGVVRDLNPSVYRFGLYLVFIGFTLVLAIFPLFLLDLQWRY